ncbi:MAG: hypothetical protein WAU39_19135 [Polyangiales bacterium]|jgi:hypothetical protein
MTTKKKSTKSSPANKGAAEGKPAKKGGGAAAIARKILAEENPQSKIAEHGETMMEGPRTAATQSARVLSELVTEKPELVVPLVSKFAKGISSSNKRVVQASAEALPAIARIAPARVARQLDVLKSSFQEANDVGKDGLVKTFAALCTASVAYQKRLEPVLTLALSKADGKTLLAWSQIVLPALKGEPHARARAVVEGRLNLIPRSYAQQIADFLGIKLRLRYR